MQRTIHKTEKLDFPFAIINIILLLLFFFIVTGSIVGKNETSVAPPLTSRLTTERLPRPLLVIDKSGALYLDEIATTVPDAIARMKAGGAEPARLLNVIADRSVSAQGFLDIIDGLRRGGVPVRIITLNEKRRGDGAN
jgi:biopolymer transport protein ExbD